MDNELNGYLPVSSFLNLIQGLFVSRCFMCVLLLLIGSLSLIINQTDLLLKTMMLKRSCCSHLQRVPLCR